MDARGDVRLMNNPAVNSNFKEVILISYPERVFMNANKLPVLIYFRKSLNEWWIYYWIDKKWEPQYRTLIPPRLYPDNLPHEIQELYGVKHIIGV